ncbi:uracil-xanthine permease family protein [Lactococcus garvieae]|uniref:Uracil-xanthine permease family protein n=3 Tax=Lactococcus TaxID=1357 RepID=A0AA43PE61_9LACT|nr:MULTISPECIES: uracil-xanthine permease family protein [Lactococcus]MCH1713340.1 uracil-xanthine permease family protein [Lactococcus petauri]MCH1722174.1 uracil-xanthine permease family protein [Lactococcus formosensis]MCI3871862.1 uracil-xanthine permease family protein [Lactococcus petauri]MCO7180157.1 uracil-xanthine permease family protein [Lactococcus formosensis]MCR6589998.1 uracil-xanthine permease family protein [Lactococcus petauri]
MLLKVDEKPKGGQWFGLSFQHLFAMFGSTVLVPILVGIDPAIALLSSGLGTLAHMSVTRFKVPAYMGSSFAYIGAMQLLMKQGGMPAIAQGALTGGLVYLLVAIIVRFAGQGWIDRVLPPIVVGPIVMVIGLSLAPVAINDSMYTNPGAMTGYSLPFLAISMITVMAIVIFSIYGKGFLSVVPILLGIVTGYIAAIIIGKVTGQSIVDFSNVSQASWLSLPTMEIPFLSYKWAFYPSAILTMAPIAFVTMTEHFGHIMVLNSLTGKDYFKEPGLDRTLAGDGVAQVIASFIGAPPVTSYGENIGVMAITKIHSIYVIAGAAVLAVVVSFIGKLTALLTSIPSPVIGGASIALFGVIAASGLKIIVENKINFDIKRNLLISSVVLVIGIGGMVLDITQNLQISSVAIATIIGIVLNLVLPEEA